MMAAPPDSYQKLLMSYEDPAWRTRSAAGRLFGGVLGLSLLLSLGFGLLLLTVDLPPLVYTQVEKRRATFQIDKPEPVKQEVVAAREEKPPADVEDLTARPELGHKETVPAIEPPQPHESPAPVDQPEPRRVYGVRKVFARGLGTAGGNRAAGIVSRRGNTLDKAPDDLVANEADLTGHLAPLSTVTSAPVLIGRIKPEYTEEMVANRVAGMVRGRLLVDIDGRVKMVEMLEDIGFGTREVAETAFRELKFKPAERGDEPVAVWIIMKYRFEFRE